MKLIFDKDAENEREMALDYASENLLMHRMNGNLTVPLTPSTVPDLSPLVEDPEFSTMELQKNNGEVITVQGDYARISALNTSVDERAGTYNVTIVLEGGAENA